MPEPAGTVCPGVAAVDGVVGAALDGVVGAAVDPEPVVDPEPDDEVGVVPAVPVVVEPGPGTAEARGPVVDGTALADVDVGRETVPRDPLVEGTPGAGRGTRALDTGAFEPETWFCPCVAPLGADGALASGAGAGASGPESGSRSRSRSEGTVAASTSNPDGTVGTGGRPGAPDGTWSGADAVAAVLLGMVDGGGAALVIVTEPLSSRPLTKNNGNSTASATTARIPYWDVLGRLDMTRNGNMTQARSGAVEPVFRHNGAGAGAAMARLASDLVRVRLATMADAERVNQIYNREVTESTVTLDMVPRTLDEQRRYIAERSGGLAVVVACEGSEIAGFASLSFYRDRPGYRTSVEDSIYVDRAWQRRGVGHLLLGELLSLASSHGFHTCFARIVGPQEASVALHRRHGFVEVGIEREVARKFNRWHDVGVYQKML